MYLGRIVELGDAAARDRRAPPSVHARAAIRRSTTGPDRRGQRIVLTGDIPSPAAPPPGCVFHTRCQHPLKDQDCASIVPPLAEKAPGQFAACIKEPALVTISDEHARHWT